MWRRPRLATEAHSFAPRKSSQLLSNERPMNTLRSLTWQTTRRNVSFTTADLNRLLGRFFCNRWSLLVCKFLIGVVSAYDIYLTVKYVEYLGTYELNPVGRWLMHLDDGPECELKQVAGFITAKFAGNFLVLSVIEFLASWKRYLATAVAVPVVLFQLGLLFYLMFGAV